MENQFLKAAKAGKNHWWRYALGILSIVLGFVITNLIIRTFIHELRAKFEGNDLADEVLMYTVITSIFAFVLVLFGFSFQKLHKRYFRTLLSYSGRFSFRSFLVGFGIYAILIFVSNLITGYGEFGNFLKDFKYERFIILFVLAFVSFGVQSFFEELIIRSYLMQGLSLKIKKISALIVVNGFIFGLIHFGYGIENFVASWLFGIAFSSIVIFQKRIDYVSGAHMANNLVLSIFFIDLNEASKQEFSWSFNFAEIGIRIIVLTLFIALSYYLSKRNVIKTAN